MEVKPVRCFLAVVDSGSISGAADRLNVAQPWLSTYIRNFERRLGFDLFDRSGRRVTLSPEGAMLVDPARRFIAEAERFGDASRSVARKARPPLLIACPSAATGVPERDVLIDLFMRDRPMTPVRIVPYSSAILETEGAPPGSDIVLSVGPLPERLSMTDRLLLRRQLAVLLLPEEWPIGRRPTIDLAMLDGISIAVMPEDVHPSLCTGIYKSLGDHGARLIEVPDASFAGLQKFAASRRIAALTVDTMAAELGDSSRLVMRRFTGDPFGADLHLLKPEPGTSRDAAWFWDIACRLFAGKAAA